VNKKGIFIVSLDFELNWGVHDVFSLEQYGENLKGVRTAIPRMLALFEQFDIHATWATVGMLCFDSKEELMGNLPLVQPKYENEAYSSYGKLVTVGENEEQDPYHFGLSLVRQIASSPNQEIGTHTFSHYYCLENGQNAEQFEADLITSIKVCSIDGQPIRSLVFPRNQWNKNYLQLCKDAGIVSFRGNEENWMYKAGRFGSQSKVKRMLRLLDCYINISGQNTYPIDSVEMEPLTNLRSSRFLRPFSQRLRGMEPLRLRRIKKGIESAARKGEVFHLWWHPHNFGRNTDENISFLTEILQYVEEMKVKYGFQSFNMGEVSSFMAKHQYLKNQE